jgi:hypothetical protein
MGWRVHGSHHPKATDCLRNDWYPSRRVAWDSVAVDVDRGGAGSPLRSGGQVKAAQQAPIVLPCQLLVPVVQSLDVDAQELPRNIDVEQPSRGRNDGPQASLFRACQKRVFF